MNDRSRRPEPAPPRARGHIAAAAAAASATAAAAAAATQRPSVFRGQLTRRPTAPNPPSAGDTMRHDVQVLVDSSEIVVRNQHGEFDVGDPPLPMHGEPDDQTEEHHEAEKEKRRLAEAVKRHNIHHGTMQDPSEELVETVRADLRAKVSALAHDNWMFESEDPSRT
ncbi:hypothetical protein CDD81_3641 [Ophiocordyceps australis]|uniref:Uncharacterized protein n=1 Tax=Ophiocordyceps australis TaxID=1399860 RepID=A0A2C5YDF6_9HYPO|nr:hypothetical protein CDD81_3641 [Ophiocordyceps australis]